MSRLIHARLDDESEAIRRELASCYGWSDSKIVREGIKSLDVLLRSGPKREIVGQGKFSSGVPDLGSNKEHLKDFGK